MEGRRTFRVSHAVSGVEVRLFAAKGFTAVLDHVEIGLAEN